MTDELLLLALLFFLGQKKGKSPADVVKDAGASGMGIPFPGGTAPTTPPLKPMEKPPWWPPAVAWPPPKPIGWPDSMPWPPPPG
jgi:hypothetical protein